MISPMKGMAFVIEHIDDGLTASARALGFVSATERSVGVQGVVYAVNDEPRRCLSCKKCEMEPTGIKVGDTVLYSKFVAEQVCIKDAEGKEIKHLKSVPLDAILGIVS